MVDKAPRLKASQLGPIQAADITFGDLTVLLGPQASGKSLLLQTLRLILDAPHVVQRLTLEGYEWDDARGFAGAFYGEGMEALWSPASTRVSWQGRAVSLSALAKTKSAAIGVPRPTWRLYVPAHRAITFRNSWPRHFGDYSVGDPFVLREFSDELRTVIAIQSRRQRNALFPLSVGQQSLFSDFAMSIGAQRLLETSVYGGFQLKHERHGLQKRLVLQQGADSPLPFLVWSTGQRELSPLLLSCLPLLDPEHAREAVGTWVVMEEPEMGLHPRAIVAVLFLLLELLAKGYRICVSTHSPHVLDLLWALRVLAEKNADPAWVLRLFDLEPEPDNLAVAKSALAKTIKVYYLDRQEAKAIDVSRLDPDSPNVHETSWGGLTEWSTKTADVIADFVANQA
ncbi:MAG: ATP-binding protein [Myxococcales bacterium]|nr:ATP-binding protein [Myxococcales bacterium]